MDIDSVALDCADENGLRILEGKVCFGIKEDVS
jgi:hypothetical protein